MMVASSTRCLLRYKLDADNEPDLSSSESAKEASIEGLALKDEGNAALAAGRMAEAVHHYSTALSHIPNNAMPHVELYVDRKSVV